MRLLYRSFAFITLAACAVSSAVVMAFDRFVSALLAIVPAKPRLATDGPALARDIRGQTIDPALRQSMRHEAGVSRRAAPRHI
jgi:hypothetical protein